MTKRQTELDILRFLAVVAVVMTHVCGGAVDTLPVTSPQWAVMNVMRAAVTWDVPVFVMISGRFFLDDSRPLTTKSLFGKSLKRLVIAFVVWSGVYQIFYTAKCAMLGVTYLNIKGILAEWVTGAYHLWYLYMLAGLYILTPLLRKIAEDKRLTEYFLVLFLVFQFLTNYGVALPFVGSIVEAVLGKMYFHFALGYAGYFLLGWYLHRYGVPEKWEKPLYGLGLLLILFSCAATTLHSRMTGVADEWFSKYQTPNIIVESAAVYLFFVKRGGRIAFSEKTQRIFGKLTELGFGVYLIHALVIECVSLLGISVAAHPLVMVPAVTMVVLLVSFALTGLIRKIPLVGKTIT